MIKKIISVSVMQIIAKIMTLITSILIARSIGPELFGVYGLTLSLLALFTMPIIAGLPNLIIRQVSKYNSKGEWEKFKGIIKVANVYICGLTFVIGFILLAAYANEIYFLDVSKESYIYIAILLPINGYLVLQGAVLNGLDMPFKSGASINIIFPFLMLISLSVYTASDRHASVDEILLIYTICMFFTLLFSYRLSHTNLPKGLTESKNIEYKIKEWIYILIPFSIMTVVTTMNAQLANLFLGFDSDHQSIGYLRVALQGISVLLLVNGAINTVIAPKIAMNFSNENRKDLQNEITRTTQINTIVTLSLFLIMIFLGETVVSILFGNEYLPAYQYLLILALGYLICSIIGPVGLILNMVGLEKNTLVFLTLGLVINIVLLSVLVPNYQGIGAVISTSFSMVLMNTVMAVICYRKAKIKSWFWMVNRNGE